ncbi:MAG: hypothetical protein HFE86_09325 [Clostridiales bacterium]|nr:hypothetical protein [Clostridiales bacterium]
MRKELDICLQKDVTTFLYESLPLCVVLGQPRLYEWFLQHYIEMYLVDAKKGERYNFYALRYAETTSYLQYSKIKEALNFNQVEAAVVNSKVDIVTFLKAQVDCGVYAIVFLNEWAVPHKQSYHKTHWYHESLVYGYDDEKGTLCCVSFDQRRNFTSFEVDYGDFREGFQMICNDPSDIAAYQRYLYLLKPQDIEYAFDLKRFAHQLDNLLRGRMDRIDRYNLDLLDLSTPREDWTYSFGLSLLDRFADILQTKYRDGADISYLDFHILQESRRLMHKRLSYLHAHYLPGGEMEELAGRYGKLADAYDVIRNLFLKLNRLQRTGGGRQRGEEYLQRILTLLQEAGQTETELLTAVRFLVNEAVKARYAA